MVAGEEELDGRISMKQLLDAAVVEVLCRSARPAWYQRQGSLIRDPIVVQRNLPRLLIRIEKGKHAAIRAHGLVEPIHRDLKEVRRQILQPIPSQNAVVGFRREIEVLRHKLIREQRVTLVPKAIGNTSERCFDAPDKVFGRKLMPEAGDEADVFLTGAGEVEQVQGAAISQEREKLVEPITGTLDRLEVAGVAFRVRLRTRRSSEFRPQCTIAAAQQTLQTIDQPFVLILTSASSP